MLNTNRYDISVEDKPKKKSYYKTCLCTLLGFVCLCIIMLVTGILLRSKDIRKETLSTDEKSNVKFNESVMVTTTIATANPIAFQTTVPDINYKFVRRVADYGDIKSTLVVRNYTIKMNNDKNDNQTAVNITNSAASSSSTHVIEHIAAGVTANSTTEEVKRTASKIENFKSAQNNTVKMDEKNASQTIVKINSSATSSAYNKHSSPYIYF